MLFTETVNVYPQNPTEQINSLWQNAVPFSVTVGTFSFSLFFCCCLQSICKVCHLHVSTIEGAQKSFDYV